MKFEEDSKRQMCLDRTHEKENAKNLLHSKKLKKKKKKKYILAKYTCQMPIYTAKYTTQKDKKIKHKNNYNKNSDSMLMPYVVDKFVVGL